MSDIIDTIKTRRSVKKFKSDPVPEDVIAKIVEAGLYAPSARGMQSPIIVAVTDKATRDKLSAVNAEICGRPSSDPFYGAPAVLVVLYDKNIANGIYDGSLVMGNLMLAAHGLGVGSCWIHRAKEEFEMPEWKEWLKSLGVVGDYVGVGHCVLGYADGAYPAPAPRKDGRVYWVK